MCVCTIVHVYYYAHLSARIPLGDTKAKVCCWFMVSGANGFVPLISYPVSLRLSAFNSCCRRLSSRNCIDLSCICSLVYSNLSFSFTLHFLLCILSSVFSLSFVLAAIFPRFCLRSFL